MESKYKLYHGDTKKIISTNGRKKRIGRYDIHFSTLIMHLEKIIVVMVMGK